MGIWTQDISKNKYFWIFIGCIAIVWLIAYGIQYNSTEKQCERKVANASTRFGGNALTKEAIKAASRNLIDECIKDAKQ